MNLQQVLSLVLLLAPEGPYFRLMSGRQIGRLQHSLARRLQIGMTDPALLAHICQSYAEATLPLPQFRWPAGVIRAYDFFLDPKRGDKNLAMAHKLQRPESHFERSIIRASLMCPSATDEEVAQVFQLEPEVVTHFDLLWWNVRARAGDYLFLIQVLSGKHSVVQPAEEGESAEWASRLLRVGRATGSMQEVLVEAGLVPPTAEDIPEKKLLEAILRKFLEGVLASQQKGQLSKRELALLEKYLTDLEVEPACVDLFLTISQDKQCQAVIRKMVHEQMMEKLVAQRLEWQAEKKKVDEDYQI